MGRPTWDQHFITMAHQVAEMSTCASSRKVGAVFVKNRRILASGVNGVPSGYPHPSECLRRRQGVPSGQGLDICLCTHAETNGIANAARHGISLEGSDCFVTCQPCAPCMGLMANTGIKRIVFGGDYPDDRARAVAEYAGITLEAFQS